MKTPFKLLMLAFSVLSFFNLNAQDNKKVVRLIDGESTIYTNNIALDFDDINNIDNVHITNTVNVIGNENTHDEELTFVIGEEPTAFSPNSDGINDFFEINYMSNFPEEVTSQIIIFNVSGHVVFRSHDTHASQLSWNGNIEGSHSRPANEGTYYYILLIECKGQILRRTGFVELRR